MTEGSLIIGEGSFAKVKHIGKFVEKTSKRLKGYVFHEWLDEVFLLKLLQSTYVPVLYDYSIYHQDRVRIKMGYAGIDLKVFYRNICDQDRERYLKDHFIQITRGLQFMHSMHIVHCDIKPKNILLSNGCIKLIDFNLSQFENAIYPEYSVYAWPYRPLEVIHKESLSCLSDIYALGAMIFYLNFNEGPLYTYKEDKPPCKDLHLQFMDSFDTLVHRSFFKNSDLDEAVKLCFLPLRDRCDATELLELFSANTHKKIKKSISLCDSEPFPSSFQELLEVLVSFEIESTIFHLVYLVCWFTWSNINFDKESLQTMVFLCLKMLCRGNYALIQKIEKQVIIDVDWLQNNSYLNDFEFLLVAYENYSIFKAYKCEDIFATLAKNNTLDLYSIISKEQ